MTRKVARKNSVADRAELLGRAGEGLRILLVELVPEQHAERGPDRAERQGAEQAPGDLADPFHGHARCVIRCGGCKGPL